MKKLKLPFLLVLLTILFSCSKVNTIVRGESVEYERSSLYERIYPRLDTLNAQKSDEKSGPIKIIMLVANIIHGDQTIEINDTMTIVLDKESDFIEFNDHYGIKLFHTETVEYGNLKHLIRYDFFTKDSTDNCWRRKARFGYRKITLNLSKTILEQDYIAIGNKNDHDYIRLNWSLIRIE